MDLNIHIYTINNGQKILPNWCECIHELFIALRFKYGSYNSYLHQQAKHLPHSQMLAKILYKKSKTKYSNKVQPS